MWPSRSVKVIAIGAKIQFLLDVHCKHISLSCTVSYTYCHLFSSNDVQLQAWMQNKTSGYATWFTAGGAIRIAHYDVIDEPRSVAASYYY